MRAATSATCASGSSNQAAGGYVEYDAAGGRFTLPPEHAAALADEQSPAFMLGGLDILASTWADEDRFVDAFRSGRGIGWHEHDRAPVPRHRALLPAGLPADLVADWIPALDGVEEKLRAGRARRRRRLRPRRVDDHHGRGLSALALRRVRLPRAVDRCAPTSSPEAAGVAERCTFEVAPAQDFPVTGDDLVCNFDCLHDMGDPVGAARPAAAALKPDGTYMIVEPQAGDRLEDNLNPVGRLFYGASSVICTAHAKSQAPDGPVLGAQAGEARLHEILAEAGFTRVRRAAETPFNMILEARL